MATDAIGASGTDGRSSETFLEWFQWRRVFVVTTWCHLALVAIFIVLELLPRVWKVVRKFARLFRGRRTRVGDLPPAETPLTFEDAMNAGKFKVRWIAVLVHYCSLHVCKHLRSAHGACRHTRGLQAYMKGNGECRMTSPLAAVVKQWLRAHAVSLQRERGLHHVGTVHLQGTNKSYSVFEVEKRLLMGDAETTEIKRRTTQSIASRKRTKTMLSAAATKSGELTVPIGAVPSQDLRGLDFSADSHSLAMPPASSVLLEQRRKSARSSNDPVSRHGSDADSVDLEAKETMTFQLAPPRRSGGGGLLQHPGEQHDPPMAAHGGNTSGHWLQGGVRDTGDAARAVGSTAARRLDLEPSAERAEGQMAKEQAEGQPLQHTDTL